MTGVNLEGLLQCSYFWSSKLFGRKRSEVWTNHTNNTYNEKHEQHSPLTAKCPLQPYACAHHSCQCYWYVHSVCFQSRRATMELGIGFVIWIGGLEQPQVLWLQVPQVRLQLVWQALAFAPAAAAAVGVLAFFVLEAARFVFTAKPSSMGPDDVGHGRRAQLRVSKQHLKNRSKPKGVASHIACNKMCAWCGCYICQPAKGAGGNCRYGPLWLTIVLHRYARLTSCDPWGQATLDRFSRLQWKTDTRLGNMLSSARHEAATRQGPRLFGWCGLLGECRDTPPPPWRLWNSDVRMTYGNPTSPWVF